jgi:hypothetical protein
MKIYAFLISVLFSITSSAAGTYDCILDSGDKIQLDVQGPTTIIINNIEHIFKIDNADSSKVYSAEGTGPEGKVSWELVVPGTLASTTPPQQFQLKYTITSEFEIFGTPMSTDYFGTCTLR